ncbi:hypothetical protein V6N13_059278 [Hibiscus sabdariffa]
MSTTSEISGADFPTLSEMHGGRPPEALVLSTGFSPLERQDSPVWAELQPVAKKGRCGSHNADDHMKNEWLSEDGYDIHMEGAKGDRHIGMQPNNTSQLEQEHVGMKISFRDTLIGTKFTEPKKSLSELDVIVNDDDVLYGGIACCQK